MRVVSKKRYQHVCNVPLQKFSPRTGRACACVCKESPTCAAAAAAASCVQIAHGLSISSYFLIKGKSDISRFTKDSSSYGEGEEGKEEKSSMQLLSVITSKEHGACHGSVTHSQQAAREGGARGGGGGGMMRVMRVMPPARAWMSVKN